ncbi:uncharacterized protein LOC113391050 [Ctenocephalides felis]|uniref:uncharacterized protein LOC113391050 n=2 Tax=Ctenocephalides felis TaxID=7515 RepID=UPI000E6E2A34|nr:uncharacterized protein LOC113391050 [Ctenocephalides felis]
MSFNSKDAGIPSEKCKLIQKYSNILSNRNLDVNSPKIRTYSRVSRRNILDTDISKTNGINTNSTETNVQSIPTVNILGLYLSSTKAQSSSKPEDFNNNINQPISEISTHKYTNIIDEFSGNFKVKESQAEILTRRCSAGTKNASTKNESNKVTSQGAKMIRKSNDKLCVDYNVNELSKFSTISTTGNELNGNDLSTKGDKAGMNIQATLSTYRNSLIEDMSKSKETTAKNYQDRESTTHVTELQNRGSSNSSNLVSVFKLIEDKILSKINEMSNNTIKNEQSLTINTFKTVECSKQGTSKSSKNSKASHNDNLTKYKSPFVMSIEETNIIPETSQAVNKIEAATKNASEANINLNRISQTSNRSINLNIDSDKIECDIEGVMKDALNMNKEMVEEPEKKPAKNRRLVKSKPNSIKTEQKSLLSSTESNKSLSIIKQYKPKKLSIALDKTMVDAMTNTQHEIIKSKTCSSKKLTAICNAHDIDTGLENDMRIETNSKDKNYLNSILSSGCKRKKNVLCTLDNAKDKIIKQSIHNIVDLTTDEYAVNPIAEFRSDYSDDLMASDKVEQNVFMDLSIDDTPEQDNDISIYDSDDLIINASHQIPNGSSNACEIFDIDSTDSEPEMVNEVNLNSPSYQEPIISNEASPKGGSMSTNISLDKSRTIESNSYNKIETINLNGDDHIDFCTEAQIDLINNNIYNIDPKYASIIKPCSVVLEDCLEPVHIEPEIDINIETTVHACIPCNETYTTLKDLKKHVYTTHVSDTTTKCFICDVEVTNMNNMTTHILTHMLTVIYICKICSAVKETQESYDEHMLTHRKKNFVCDVCGKTCSTLYTLSKHKIVHQPERYKCKVCSKIFGNTQSLNQHMLIHGERKFVCEICDATFYRRQALNVHVKMHSTERAYKCNFCSKTYITRSNLVSHARVHDKTKQKKCEYCSKTFLTKQARLQHLYKYENVQLHQCNLCKKVYETLSELKTHEQKHNGDLETFQCRICGELFRSKVKLSHHREGCREKNDSNLVDLSI